MFILFEKVEDTKNRDNGEQAFAIVVLFMFARKEGATEPQLSTEGNTSRSRGRVRQATGITSQEFVCLNRTN